MATITNGVTSVTLGGLNAPVNPSGLTAKEITRDGVAGKALISTGFVGQPWSGPSWATSSNATTLAVDQIAYKALINSVVTLTDDNGTVWYNILVLDVHIPKTQKHTAASDGSAHMIYAYWTFQSVVVAY